MSGVGVDEHHRAAADRLQAGDGIAHHGVLRVIEPPPLLGREDSRAVGHERTLLGPDGRDERHEIVVRVPFDIELE